MGRDRAGIIALTAAMVAAAVLLAGPISDLGAPATSVRLPWPALAALFAAAVLRVHIQFRREVHSVNPVELPLVLGLHLASPPTPTTRPSSVRPSS